MLHGAIVDYSEDKYKAFCHGFATLEYTSTLVRNKDVSTTMMVANTRTLFIESGEVAEIIVAEEYPKWLDTHSNIHGVVTKRVLSTGSL